MLNSIIVPVFSPYTESVTLPRWVNIDDRRIKDTWTGKTIVLSLVKNKRPRTNEEVMEVVAALNRIYGGP